MSIEDARKRREAPLDTPSNLGSNATKDISAALTVLLACSRFTSRPRTSIGTYQARISGIITSFLRAGCTDFRDDGRHRGKSAQDRRHNDPLDRPHRQDEAYRGQ